MSGLSHLELEGCLNLLGMLDNDEIMALCDTVTNCLVQPVDRQDAIRAILVYSQNVELLRRKKVHREVIFRYLATQGVVVPPTTEKQSYSVCRRLLGKTVTQTEGGSRASYKERGHLTL